MSQFAIACFLFGAVFGMRFRVMVLLPLTLAIALITIVIAISGQLTLLEGGKTYVICAFSLQGGYLFGSLGRFATAAARAARTVARPLKLPAG